MESNITETCAICLTNLNDSTKDDYILSCHHKFHTECILNWFRSMNGNGNCPLCNDNPFITNENTINNHSILSTSLFIDERFKILSKYSRKKISPQTLQKEVNDYKVLLNEYNDIKKQRKNYDKLEEVKNVKKNMKELQQKDWKLRIKLNKKKNHIVALYPTLSFI
jgi:hypothetical protein